MHDPLRLCMHNPEAICRVILSSAMCAIFKPCHSVCIPMFFMLDAGVHCRELFFNMYTPAAVPLLSEIATNLHKKKRSTILNHGDLKKRHGTQDPYS